MTFFKKIFGKRPATFTTEMPALDTVKEISKDLFIEERHPRELESQSKLDQKPKAQTILEALLELDYGLLGCQDGYRLHDLYRLEEQIELIAADFRQAYDKALQEIEIQLDQLGMHLTIKMEEDAPDLYAKIQSRHKVLLQQKQDLMLQKDLAVTGEGYMEKPVKYYKAGFKEGYDLYIQDKLVFKHIKIL